MKKLLLAMALAMTTSLSAQQKPWQHGPLKVSDNGRFLMHQDGTPFFYLSETAWLMPERLTRDEVTMYLQQCRENGFNVVQMQVMNGVPSYNVYGQPSVNAEWDFGLLEKGCNYSYWNHVDHIVNEAERMGIYVGMVCIWGSQVKSGNINEEQARSYGSFLARRYGRKPNIVWIIGGDVQADIHKEVWEALATTIRENDGRHLMTFHPRGRHTSAKWWAGADWIDFHSYQSGHRRYGQRGSDKTYPIPDNTEEDCFQYVDSTWKSDPHRPVLDDEPVYEDIPQGLHSGDEPRWTAADVRRYAYWDVFAGCCGHAYGHNSIMQFYRPGQPSAYFAELPWYAALNAPGFRQMKIVKQLMLSLPYFDRVPDQSVVTHNGQKYDRLAATRGEDYLLVYNYTGRLMEIDLTKISGEKKNLWWMDAQTGRLRYLGTFGNKTVRLRPHDTFDGVLIAIDSEKQYITKQQENILP